MPTAHPSLEEILTRLIAGWEGECVEFKEANDNFPTPDIGKYFSALSNEANLRGLDSAWLVFGVNNKSRRISGTQYRENHERLHSLKHQIASDTDPNTTFREIHELHLSEGRVILFEIPPAPRGIPIAWKTHHYARDGESLTGLSIGKIEEIRTQSAMDDWSAVVIDAATLEDLDLPALAKAKDIYTAKYRDRIPEETIRAWNLATFLEKLKLTIKGKLTRAALLLLGKPEAMHYLSPFVAEISWKLEGEEQDYEHFYPPFLLATSRLYEKIRNVRLTVLPVNELIPVEVSKYDQRIILEALHNCVAHQDYTKCERVLVTERPSELLFQNAGTFFDGTPEDYYLHDKTPTRYRNRLLAEAMVHLRMIDTMGFGIRQLMWRGQAKRYLPLPDYDKTGPNHVVLKLQGRFLDENYSRALLSQSELSWHDVLALDRVQKGLPLSSEAVRALRGRKLIEGRKPHLHISSVIAAATDQKATYIRNRRQDDAHFRKMILDYLGHWKQASGANLRELLDGKFPSILTPEQQRNKLNNILTALRQEGKIVNTGSRRAPHWVLFIK